MDNKILELKRKVGAMGIPQMIHRLAQLSEFEEWYREVERFIKTGQENSGNFDRNDNEDL